jgi:hypothetical protein
MKIRTGFVSNSSSSSFAIIGTQLTNTIIEGIEKNNRKEGIPEFIPGCDHRVEDGFKFCPECGAKVMAPNPEYYESNEIECWWGFFEEKDMSYYTETDWGEIVGFPIRSVDEEKSIRQIKEELSNSI